MKLLVDIGNHRIKWATSDQLENLLNGAGGRNLNNETIPSAASDRIGKMKNIFSRIKPPAGITVASVAGGGARADIRRVCDELWRLSPVFAESSARAFGVTNNYRNAAELGVDRWAALIAVREMFPGQDVVVIDAGTAITVDCIDENGQFDGGIVSPGINTMIHSLSASTADIHTDGFQRSVESLTVQNKDTAGAVENGALVAAVSSIDCLIDYYRKEKNPGINTIITGGDAGQILKLSAHSLTAVPNLVLMGLHRLSGGRDK